MSSSTSSLSNTMSTMTSNLKGVYDGLQTAMQDPSMGSDPSSLLAFQFRMNEWSTMFSTASNTVSSMFQAANKAANNISR